MVNDGKVYVKKKTNTNYKNNAIFYFISICTIFQFHVFLIKKIMSVFMSCTCVECLLNTSIFSKRKYVSQHEAV